jgi:hypothetical protein
VATRSTPEALSSAVEEDTMRRSFPSILAFGVALILVPASLAQIPDQFTNLKVLPKDMPKRELVNLMRDFAGSLGVRCNHCHVGENAATLEGFDFASDDKETKRVARAMLQMTNEINGKLLPTIGRESPVQVRCATCHRGVTKPQTLDQILLAEVAKGGVDSAKTRYRELRTQYYGTGSYDFSGRTMNMVAEKLARGQKNFDAAAELMKLHIEFNPDKADAYIGLGQLYSMKGDKEAAIAALERAVALEPENAQAKQMLESVRSGK